MTLFLGTPRNVARALVTLVVAAASMPCAASEATPLIKAFVTVQDAQGMTQADFSSEGLKNIEQWLVKTTETKTRAAWQADGIPNAATRPLEIVSQAMYVTAGSMKLILVKINNNDTVRMVVVMGVIGPDLHRVNCIREGQLDIPVWSGPCGQKVKEVFGVSLAP